VEAVQQSVCLIDDEHELLDGFGAVLSANYKVYTFSSPLEALKAFDEGLDPTVVVSDLRMPEMGGLQMIEKIREKHLHSKIIVASGNADKSALNNWSNSQK
jgi:DNA-binding NtrC family response regulator